MWSIDILFWSTVVRLYAAALVIVPLVIVGILLAVLL